MNEQTPQELVVAAAVILCAGVTVGLLIAIVIRLLA